MSLDRQVRNGNNPAPKEVQDHHSQIPAYAYLLNTKCKVQVACTHRPRVLAASSSTHGLLKPNNTSALLSSQRRSGPDPC